MPTVEQLAELDATITVLKAHPEAHNQRAWMRVEGATEPPVITPALDCGTAFCIAGAVCARAGAKAVWTPWEDDYGNVSIFNATDVITRDGQLRRIADYARELLGLNWWDGDALFSAYNSMADIERIRDRIAERVAAQPRDEYPAGGFSW